MRNMTCNPGSQKFLQGSGGLVSMICSWPSCDLIYHLLTKSSELPGTEMYHSLRAQVPKHIVV